MKKDIKDVQLCCENSFYSLYNLESIIKTTRESCQYKELNSKSSETNSYIIMLNLALDEISNLKKITQEIEENIYLLN